MATVTTNTKLSALAYAANEAITVNPNVTLTIDASNTIYPKSIAATSGGVIEFVNPSLSQIICFTLYGANSAAYQLNVSTGATLRARGKMLTIHTGTGAANQVIDFAIGELAKVPYPSCVLIEHSAGSGAYDVYEYNNGSHYVPYPIVCTAGKPKVLAPTDVSNGECGRVLFWDATTRKLSCGDGTRGNVIPNGCKVLIPNICIHANGAIADNYGTRAMVYSNYGGIIDLECVAFSDAFTIYSTAANGATYYKNVGMVGVMYHNAQNAPITANYLTVNPCCNWVAVLLTTALNLLCYGAAKSIIKDIAVISSRNLSRLDANSASATHIAASLLARGSGSTMANAYLGIIGDRDVNHYVAYINGFQNSTIKNVTFINGPLFFNGLSKNIRAIGFKHASSFKGVAPSFGTQGITVQVPCSNIVIEGIKRIGSPVKSASVIQIDEATENISAFLDMSEYPLNDATAATIISSNCATGEFEVANATTSAGTATVFSSSLGVDQTLRLKGAVATTAKIYPSANAYYDGVSGLPENVIASYYGISNYCAMYLLALSNTPNSGWICFSTFGEGENVVLSGGAQADSGALWLRTLGAQMIAESKVFHGILAFNSAALKYDYTQNGVAVTNSTIPPSNMSIKFAVARDTGAFTLDAPLTVENLQTALANLYEYNHVNGCRIRLTVVATAQDSTLTLNKVYWGCDHDVNYKRPNVELLVRGVQANDTITMHLLEDDSVVATFVGGGKQLIDGTTALGKAVYFNRYENGILSVSTKPAPQVLQRGNNGNVDMFSKKEMSLVQEAEILKALEVLFPRVDAVYMNTLKTAETLYAVENLTTAQAELAKEVKKVPAKTFVLVN